MSEPLSHDEFASRLRAIGEASYHDRHPFHVLMNEGKLTREQLQGWVANRFYYQTQIPIKDAAILSRCPDREIRREWIRRIHEHDGWMEDEGGIERWLRLGESVGLCRKELWQHKYLLPGVRFAVDAYVEFCRSHSWLEGVASSLTELFAPSLHQKRLEAFRKFYPWMGEQALEYGKTRLVQAPRDVEFALRVVLERARSWELQKRCLEALHFKCQLLWAMLDAIYLAYVIGVRMPQPPWSEA
ncbi:pyrroloquinoline-quinone synthase PqqC [Candidatus Methylacidithermus pantelleriae]|uniref:Pyrroloquinoline-quinone synthase n=1 Tax=Candidatus Methylacidithermus pantelleriae TaxID=2744239 RepID=A0A8J2BPX0_9BACT|nr:pyrroloquinoline-quinone synthase PqqC [Candidatus Methylacidithermus pantelleriae]CAF0705247.1 Pyrroloquinoline-quinone synthase [Candidatus Methylacidithermus pantelleriae]